MTPADGRVGDAGQDELREEWRPVLGYEGTYEASSRGRIRSLPRPNTAGGLRRLHQNSSGYLTVRLHANGVSRTHRVNVLICEAFHGPRPEGQVCRHLDDNKLNNTPANLAWGSKSDNGLDAVRNGIHYLLNRSGCSAGHRWTSENTRWVTKGDSRPYRECRICARRRDREWRERKREIAS